MAVLMTAEVPGQSQEGYEGMLAARADVLPQSPGFVPHTAHPVPGGWRLFEVGESQQAAADFFAKYVHPNLPPGIKPKRTVQPLHAVVRP